MKSLVTLGAVSAVVGGSLRVIGTFIPYVAHSAPLEGLYAVTDIGMLLGLIGAYLATSEQIGRIGLAAFAVALIGIASIVGPDSSEFGIDFYQLGAAVFVLGLAALSLQMLRLGVLKGAAGLWLLAAAGAILGAVAHLPLAIAVAGFAVGAGFLAAGLTLLRPSPRQVRPSLQPG